MLPLPGSPRARALGGFLLGWLAGTVSFLICLFWITTVTVIGWIALCLVLGLYHGIWGLFAVVVLRPLGEGSSPARSWLGSFRNLATALLAASGWVAVEWMRGTFFSGFGWNALGVGLRDSIPIAQIAAFTGTAGLTFLCVLMAATAAITIERLRREILAGRPKPHFDFFAAIFLIVLAFGHGMRVLTAPAVPTTPLRVAALQGNIPVYDYWDQKCEGRIMERYVNLTRTALALHPDLIVWPEAATPRPLLLDEIIYSQVKALQEGSRSDFLIGSIHYEAAPRGDYNSAILLPGDASVPLIYSKVHLVPFGEYVPFRRSFPPLGWIVGNRVPYDFDAGSAPPLLGMTSAPVKLGPLICFEDTLGELARRSAALGAQLLVTLTNDGWFEHSAATRQHLANARLRTIETGLPLLRVADTGVTCVVDRFGRIRETLHGTDGDTFIEGMLQTVIEVPLEPTPTFHTRHGDLFAHACVALTIAAAAGTLLARRRAA
jgi:apolipoprotein N-acyltransferase